MKHLVIDNELTYFLKKKSDNTTILGYSKHGPWYNHLKGKAAVTLKNSGNGYTFIFDNGKVVKLDYLEAHELFLMLKEENKDLKISILNKESK